MGRMSDDALLEALPAADWPEDWTADPSGRSNSSQAFEGLVGEVAQIIRAGSGCCLDPGWTQSTARMIVARLAHVHHLAPPPPGAV